RVAHRCSRLASADHLTLHSLPARRSSDLGRARLKPAVFTFATLLPTTSMIAWLWIMPLAAALRMLGMGLPSEAGELRCRLVEGRSEEHTSELQSRENLVCRLLLEKKKTDK